MPGCLSVFVSVRSSVTRRYCIQTAEPTTTQSMLQRQNLFEIPMASHPMGTSDRRGWENL